MLKLNNILYLFIKGRLVGLYTLLTFLIFLNLVKGYEIDWECIEKGQKDGCVINQNENKTQNNKLNQSGNKIPNNVNTGSVKGGDKSTVKNGMENRQSINLLTDFNKGFVEKYQKNKKEIENLKRKIREQRNDEDKELNNMFQNYIDIEDNIKNAEYVLLVKYDINNISFFEHNGINYILYITPFYFENKTQNNKLKEEFQKELIELLSLKNLKSIKEKINKIENEYQISNFYSLKSLRDISSNSELRLGRITQTKMPLPLNNKHLYNTLYYIPSKIEKYIDNEHIYFYYPISTEMAERINQQTVEEEDFNKFYCLRYKYNDNFFNLDKSICSFNTNNDENMITINMSEGLKQKWIKLNILNRGKELLDIGIMAGLPLTSLILYGFIYKLRKKRYQYEHEGFN